MARLRRAGAVLLGKAKLSEWANFRDDNASSGWSAAGGQTNNPCVLDRNPCGSSSGSAVAGATTGRAGGRRIGLWRNAQGPEVNRVLNETAASLRALGATVINTPLDDTVLFRPTSHAMLVEFKAAINAYLAQTPGDHAADLAGLIDFNRRYASLEMPLFGQGIFEDSQKTDINTDPTYAADRQFATNAACSVIDSTLAANHLDAIAGSTNGPAWMTTGQTTTCTDGADSSTFAAVAGYASVAVPAGFACGELPLDVSLFAGRFSEPTAPSRRPAPLPCLEWLALREPSALRPRLRDPSWIENRQRVIGERSRVIPSGLLAAACSPMRNSGRRRRRMLLRRIAYSSANARRLATGQKRSLSHGRVHVVALLRP